MHISKTSTLRGLIFAKTFFREVKKSTIREYLFSRINFVNLKVLPNNTYEIHDIQLFRI